VRVGADPDAPWVERQVPLHAHEAGFDLHAAVHVAAGDRPRLERLCQYLFRPPLGQQRLQQLRDGPFIDAAGNASTRERPFERRR